MVVSPVGPGSPGPRWGPVVFDTSNAYSDREGEVLPDLLRRVEGLPTPGERPVVGDTPELRKDEV